MEGCGQMGRLRLAQNRRPYRLTFDPVEPEVDVLHGTRCVSHTSGSRMLERWNSFRGSFCSFYFRQRPFATGDRNPGYDCTYPAKCLMQNGGRIYNVKTPPDGRPAADGNGTAGIRHPLPLPPRSGKAMRPAVRSCPRDRFASR